MPGILNIPQEPMAVELKDTRGETVIVILLNGHSIKVTSKFISMPTDLCSSQTSSEIFYFVQWIGYRLTQKLIASQNSENNSLWSA